MNARCHLDLLDAALSESGWRTARRYADKPPMLRVVSPDLPRVGESIWVKPGVGGVPWFMCSAGQPLAPCHDLPKACAEITERLTTFTSVPAAPPAPRLRWLRSLLPTRPRRPLAREEGVNEAR